MCHTPPNTGRVNAHQPAAAALPQKKKPADDEDDEPAPEVEEVKRKVTTKPSLNLLH